MTWPQLFPGVPTTSQLNTRGLLAHYLSSSSPHVEHVETRELPLGKLGGGVETEGRLGQSRGQFSSPSNKGSNRSKWPL